jgi:hypothetical protein
VALPLYVFKLHPLFKRALLKTLRMEPSPDDPDAMRDRMRSFALLSARMRAEGIASTSSGGQVRSCFVFWTVAAPAAA